MKHISPIRPMSLPASLRRLWLALGLMALLVSLMLAVPTRMGAQVSDGSQEEPVIMPLSPPVRLNPQVRGPDYNPHPRRTLTQSMLPEQIAANPFTSELSVTLGDRPVRPGGERPAKGSAADNNTRPMIGPGQAAPPTRDQASALQSAGWTLHAWETLNGQFGNGVPCNLDQGGAQWFVEDYGNDGFDRTWGQDAFDVFEDGFSVWPAAGGADRLDPPYVNYPDNLYSWMICGPFDFSEAADVFVDFFLWLDTEPYYDPFYFGASIDNLNFYVDSWSGYSGEWLYEPFLMTEYAGYSQVWFAWIFESDISNPDPYQGVWVDDITIWSYDAPELDPSGDLVQNGSFEAGGQGWFLFTEPAFTGRPPLSTKPDNPSDVIVTDESSVDGMYSAVVFNDGSWNDFLYQPVTIPPGTTDIQFNFWFAVTTNETTVGNDWFCASVTDVDFNIVVDLGCADAAFTTGYWQEVLYALSSQEVEALLEASVFGDVNLVFELYNRGSTGTGTSTWIDYVRFYATGGDGGAYVDLNEPNNEPATATPAACGSLVQGTIGDVISSYGDEDWFELTSVPVGPLDLDINARTKQPASALDSVVYLYADNQQTLLAQNDDDGATYDSYLTYNNTTPNATFYVLVVSYSGYGGADHFYDLEISCAGGGDGPPPPPDVPPGDADTWTIMLYLNAEDASFEPILQQYITDMEAVVNGREQFLSVVVLYDGPQDGDTVRYVLQPDGNYINGQNRWSLNEQNMGHRDTLAHFAKWAMDNYPAENYYLAIDDHGHGVYGISWDMTNNNDSLTPQEVYSALKEATVNGARKIDIFDYEACLMGMAENAYDVREWVDYVVFFEQISWGLNTYPSYFNTLQASHTPLQIGQHIVDTYYSLANNAGYPHTISLIDTGQMLAVKESATNLGNALMGTGNRTAVNDARSNAQAFAADNDATNPLYADYIDLWDLADKTAGLSGVATAAAQVKTAVQNAVVHQRYSSGIIDGFYWNHSGAHGLSIYYPAYNGSSAFNDYIAARIFQMSADESGVDGRWDEFLAWAVTQTGNGAGNGLGGDDRRGMNGIRFLQPKRASGDITRIAYLPSILKR